MNEIWKPIPEYEDYLASNIGRIKSVKKNSTCKNKEGILSQSTTKGYKTVFLSNNGKRKQFFVHRLVYLAFLGPIPADYQVNHINEDKADNRVDNLNLMTCSENIKWATGVERRRKAELNRKDLSKYVLQYDLNGNFIQKHISIAEAERSLGVYNGHASSIRSCLYGKSKYAYGFIWRYENN